MSEQGDMARECKSRGFTEAISGKLLGFRAGLCIQVEAVIAVAGKYSQMALIQV